MTFEQDDFLTNDNYSFGDGGLGRAGVDPTVEEIRDLARQASFIRRAKLFDDLTNSDQLALYNSIISDPEKYRVLEEKEKWVEEALGRGESRTKFSMFIKYLEFDEALFVKTFRALLIKFNKKADDVGDEIPEHLKKQLDEVFENVKESKHVYKKKAKKEPEAMTLGLEDFSPDV